jgi:hypothetical protein
MVTQESIAWLRSEIYKAYNAPGAPSPKKGVTLVKDGYGCDACPLGAVWWFECRDIYPSLDCYTNFIWGETLEWFVKKGLSSPFIFGFTAGFDGRELEDSSDDAKAGYALGQEMATEFTNG